MEIEDRVDHEADGGIDIRRRIRSRWYILTGQACLQPISYQRKPKEDHVFLIQEILLHRETDVKAASESPHEFVILARISGTTRKVILCSHVKSCYFQELYYDLLLREMSKGEFLVYGTVIPLNSKIKLQC